MSIDLARGTADGRRPCLHSSGRRRSSASATALTTSLAGTFASAQQRHVPNAQRRQRSALLSRGSTQASACPSTSERSLSQMSRASRANALNAPPAPAEARAPVLPVLPSHPPHRSGPDACSNARAAILSHPIFVVPHAGSPPLLDRVTRRRRSSVTNQHAQMQHHSPYRRRRHPSPLTVSNSGVFENIPAQDGAAHLSWLLRRVPSRSRRSSTKRPRRASSSRSCASDPPASC